MYNIRIEQASTAGQCEVKALNRNTTGPWFNPDLSGHGMFLEVLQGAADRFKAYWYAYLNQEPVWLVDDRDGNAASIDMFITDGVQSPPIFVPCDIRSEFWGTLTLVFSRLNALTVSWTTNLPVFSDGQVSTTRLTEINGRGCH